MQPNTSTEDLAANMPNNSLMYQTFTPTFGNLNFMIQPSQVGKVNNTFGTIPYFSLEALIYMQQMSAQTDPTTIVSGQNSGQQNIQGTTTIQDSNGITRMVMGYSPGGF